MLRRSEAKGKTPTLSYRDRGKRAVQMIDIREAETRDAAGIAALLTELEYPQTESFVAAKIERQSEHPDARMLVACEETSLLGFISLHFIPQVALEGDFCRISYFCVQGGAQSKGIGGMLEERAESIARERGCNRIEVHCHSRRGLALKFYRRQGYVESPQYLMKLLK
jgi:GNAT superfamily N-acetyltransferase